MAPVQTENAVAAQPALTTKGGATGSTIGKSTVSHHGAQAKAVAGTAQTKITRGNPVRHPAAGTGGDVANDDNPTGSDKASRADSGGPTVQGQPNPCALVSQAKAQAFTGKQLATPKEAPLGPTCLYQVSGARTTAATVVVETVAFSTLRPHVKGLSQSTIQGHTAYCGVYGVATTFVPLSGKRVLTITAPCAVGAKFAATALPKLAG